MSNLSHYRLSVGLFSFGLLCVVAEVMGDGEKPGPLDTATKTIVHRLRARGDESGQNAEMPAELVVSETDGDDGNAPTDAVSESAAPAAPSGAPPQRNPWALDSSSSGEASEAGRRPDPVPDAIPDVAPDVPDIGIIHK